MERKEQAEDFSKNSVGLVDALFRAVEKKGLVHVGRFHTFDIFTEARLMLLSVNMDIKKGLNLLDYLKGNQYYMAGGINCNVEYPWPHNVYIDINRITTSKEKMLEETQRLSEILEGYTKLHQKNL